MPSFEFMAWSLVKRTQERCGCKLDREERIQLIRNQYDVPRTWAAIVVDNMTFVQERV